MANTRPANDWPNCVQMHDDLSALTSPPRRNCAQKMKVELKKRLPFLTWLPRYSKSYFLSDLIAGITVWLTAVPQSMANVAIAGVTPEYGLYSHFVGPFLYIFLGSCRQVTIGPVSVVSLVTFQTCGENNPECAVLLGFYSGIVELVFGLLQLGILISFISEPVTTGFTAGAAIVIASSQVKNILGLDGKAGGSKFISIWEHIIDKVSTTKAGDTILGVGGIVFLFLLQKIKDRNPGGRKGQVFKYIFLARNALVVAIGMLIAYLWTDAPFKLTGKVKSGFPPVGPPTFELYNPNLNSTSERMSFTETISFMGTAPVVAAILAILQNVALSKAFGAGQKIDGTQEMIALGATNIVGGFFSSIATSGSFTRSVVNEASGVKTQMNGLHVGVLIIASLSLLTPSFQYIPKTSLATVVVTAMYNMIDFQAIFKIWKTSKLDFVYCGVTIVTAMLLGMEYGIFAGVALSAGVLLLRSLRPHIEYEFLRHNETGMQWILLKPDHGIFYPSIDFVRDMVTKCVRKYPNYSMIVIDCQKWTRWDYTSVSGIIHMAKILEKNGKAVYLYRPTESWSEALTKFGSQVPKCVFTYQELTHNFETVTETSEAKSDS